MTGLSPRQVSYETWLSHLPPNQVLRFKDIFEIRKRRNNSSFPQVLSLTNKGIIERDISNNEGQLAESYDNYQVVEKGDFVLNPMDLLSGWVARSSFEGVISNAYFVFRLRTGSTAIRSNPVFYELLLQSYYTNGILDPFGKGVGRPENGGGRWTLNSETLSTIPFPNLPLVQQDAIVEYLDTELALLDHSIEKLSELKNKVSEFRRASIVQAVQLGIESNSDTEPGPEPYLPRVRNDWGFGALRRFVDFGSGSGFPEIDQGIETEEIPFLKVNSLGQAAPNGLISVRTDTISRSTAKRLGASVFPAGSLVMAKIGAALLLGRVGVLSEASCVDNNMMVVIPKSDQHPRYYYYMLQTLEFASFVNPGAVPSTSGTAVGRQVVSKVPVAEQKRISDHLDSICETSDALSGSIEKSLGLLNERRTALISAAVTGKHELEGAN